MGQISVDDLAPMLTDRQRSPRPPYRGKAGCAGLPHRCSIARPTPRLPAATTRRNHA